MDNYLWNEINFYDNLFWGLDLPKFGNEVMKQDEDFQLGKFIARARMYSIAKWHECIGSWSHLHNPQ